MKPISSQQNWLIIANGEVIAKSRLLKFAHNSKVIALDGAAVVCVEKQVIPDIILGDFDSVDNVFLDNIAKQHNVQIIHEPCQNTTDLEKGLNFVAKYSPKKVIVCQALGLRLDHTIHNLRLLKRKYHPGFCTTLMSATEKIIYIKDKTVVLSVENTEPFAVLAFPKAKVNSCGLKYDMSELTLEFAKRESTSNHIIKKTAKLIIEGEVILIMSHGTEYALI